MLRFKKSLVLIAGIVLIGVFAIYRTATNILQTARPEETTLPTEPLATSKRASETTPTGTRKLVAETRFDVPNDDVEFMRFTVVIDSAGTIQEAMTENAETSKADQHDKEFSEGLTRAIKGKKMSELTAIDRIGKSSLTTDAFNSLLDTLKSQI